LHVLQLISDLQLRIMLQCKLLLQYIVMQGILYYISPSENCTYYLAIEIMISSLIQSLFLNGYVVSMNPVQDVEKRIKSRKCN
jgi:hypothetical protein